jgi:hypothetical protein
VVVYVCVIFIMTQFIRSFVSIALPMWMAVTFGSLYAQSPLGTLHGVTAKTDGTPIASAEVVIRGNDENTGLTIISGSDGAFSIPNLKPGRYEVKASRGELHSPPATVVLASRQDLKVDLALAATTETPGDISPALAKKLEAMEARIEQLEAELKGRTATEQKTAAEQPPSAAPRGDLVATLTKDPNGIPIVPATLAKPDLSKTVASASVPSVQEAQPAPASASPAVDNVTPFADYDWTWLNGNPRNHDVAYDSKFFTPEIRADITWNYDFNKPSDDSEGGSSELFRSNEIELEQLGLGGDFHWDNVRARFMTEFGMYSTATIRNDQAMLKANGTLPTPTAIWRKRTAAITLTGCTA